MRELERFVILQVVDQRWREHLENMDYLREGVHLRAMAQKDPLVEYTSEGHAMFEALNGAIREEVVFTLFHAELAPEDAEVLAMQDGQPDGGGFEYAHESLAGADAIAAAGMAGGEVGGSVSTAGATVAPAAAGSVITGQRVVSDREKLGRNDPCWCGSGKKFKKCHGA
jgi:preprotein translocase subunit SecA